MKKSQFLILVLAAAIVAGCSSDSSAKPEEIKAPKPAGAAASHGAPPPTE